MKKYLVFTLAAAVSLTVCAALLQGGSPAVAGGRGIGHGQALAWGCNSNGQVGNGTTAQQNSPVPVRGTNDFVAVSGGAAYYLNPGKTPTVVWGSHCIALKNDGTVWTWGWNSQGQLGNGSTTDSNVPIQVPGLTGVIAVAGGWAHSLALKSDGTVWAWGDNYSRQLGDGTNTDRHSPVQSQISNVKSMAAGADHSVALKGDGTVWAWGDNGCGQIGVGRFGGVYAPTQSIGISSVTSIAASKINTYAIKSDGTVWAWGADFEGQIGNGKFGGSVNAPYQSQNVSGAKSIAAGDYSVMAVLTDGTVRACGDNTYGKLGDGTTSSRNRYVGVAGLTNIDSVAIGVYHGLAIKNDGTLWSWGYNGQGQLGDPGSGTRYTAGRVQGLQGIQGAAVAAGAYCSYILAAADVSLSGSGLNHDGQIGDGSNTDRHVPVQAGIQRVLGSAAGGYHSLELRSDGTVHAWGLNDNGQLGDGTTQSRSVEQWVPNLYGVCAVAGGDHHSLALMCNGTVMAWGDNSSGQLGDGSFVERHSPVSVQNLNGVVAISAGASHSLALRYDGTVWAWGNNGYGQLGDGTTDNRNSPVRTNVISDAIAASGGGGHTLALRGNGTLMSWGFNGFGQLGDGSTIDRHVPVAVPGLTGIKGFAAGNMHSLAVTVTGAAFGWGCNTDGQVGDGTNDDRHSPVAITGVTDGTAIAAGYDHSLLLTAARTARAWGLNANGQLGDGTTNSRNAPVPVSGVANAWSVSGGGGHSFFGTTVNAVPYIDEDGLVPPTVPTEYGDFALFVRGSNFSPGAVVKWNGDDRDTTFLAPGLIYANIPGTDTWLSGTATVWVVSPGPGGGTSNARTLTIYNPLPTINPDGLSPSKCVVGSTGKTLKISGSNYRSVDENKTVARWNGTEFGSATSFIVEDEIDVQIPDAFLAVPGQVNVTVYNRPPGGGESNTVIFTVVTAPTVQTLAATEVLATEATVNGSILDTGFENADSSGFRYRPQGTAEWSSWTQSGSFGTGPFDVGLHDLTPGTTYEFQAMAHNMAGWGYGGTLTFSTIESIEVTTSAATAISGTGATLNGDITDVGGESADVRGFRYREVGEGTWGAWIESGSFGAGAFGHALTGLDPETTYEFQAVAHNSAGWASGGILTFSTVDMPALRTDPPTGVTGTGATLEGEITDPGGENADSRGFRFRRQGTVDWTLWLETGSFGAGTFEHAVGGLTPDTAYEVEAIAHNSAGWAYGPTVPFSTIDYPVVETDAATGISGVGAMLNGEITGIGEEAPFARGFRYREQGTAAWSQWTETGSFGTGVFSRALAGLDPVTTYEFEAMARNSAGWAYGSTLTFMTIGSPEVRTDPATAVTGTGATLNGTIIDTNGEQADERGFRYRPVGATDWAEWTEPGAFDPGAYSRAVTGLTPDTDYEFEAMAHDSAGWAYGSPLNFKTIESVEVETDPATGISGTGATLNGDITDTGGENADSRGFRFRKAGAGAWSGWTESGSFGTGGFAHAVTGLDPESAYEFQAMAHNSAGWTHGETRTFDTIDLPTLSTEAPTSVTGTGATLVGEITDTGGENADVRGVRYREQGAADWTEWTEAGSFGTGMFEHAVAGLTPDTTYEVEAIAHNSAGWAYGNTITFATIDYPEVETDPATEVTGTGALLHGEITSVGEENPDTRGFRYRRQGAASWSEWTETGSFGTGTYDLELNGLTPATDYEFQAMARNSAGWAFGGALDFTTIHAPTVQTGPAESVTGVGATLDGAITDVGGENADERGFRYRAAGSTAWTAWTEEGSFDTGSFDHDISGLTPDTDYEFQAMAHNSAGMTCGTSGTFTTPDVPAMRTDPATSITGAGATLDGAITDTGREDADERGFRYRAQGSSGWTVWLEEGSFGEGGFSRAVTGLTPGTAYEYQACAHNSGGWSYGSAVPFTTLRVYTISASVSGGHGTVSPATQTADAGENVMIDIRADSEYHASSIIDNGASRPITDPYVIAGIEGNHTVVVSFAPDEEEGSTWYLAEGTSAWGFSTYITIANPWNQQLTARLTYMDQGTDSGAGKITDREVILPPLSQTTVDPSWEVGESDFSTRVECLEGRPIAVDRTMFWNGAGAPCPEAHNSIGVTSPSTTWYLPEGSSSWGFETWTLVQNPNAAEATVNLTYMTQDAGPMAFTKKIPGDSRATYSMAADIGEHDSSVMVSSDVPVIAESSQYRNNRREGACSIGARSLSSDYYLSEGSTAWGFTTYVLIQNPNDSAANVNVTYMTPAGLVEQEPFTMRDNSRCTIKVNDVPGAGSTDLSTLVHADRPIVAERSMYWTGGSDSAEVCHNSIGLSAPHMAFYLPDGQTTGGWETWTLVQNPNPGAVRIDVSYLPENGGETVTFTDEIGPGCRKTYNMAGAPGVYPGIQGRASIMVRSLDGARPIMVERSMYRYDRGLGTDTIGAFED